MLEREMKVRSKHNVCMLMGFPLQSGKLVMKMFQKIQELIDDKEALVCVLIDEVSV